jgi:hypothetical protein
MLIPGQKQHGEQILLNTTGDFQTSSQKMHPYSKAPLPPMELSRGPNLPPKLKKALLREPKSLSVLGLLTSTGIFCNLYMVGLHYNGRPGLEEKLSSAGMQLRL